MSSAAQKINSILLEAEVLLSSFEVFDIKEYFVKITKIKSLNIVPFLFDQKKQ